MFMLSLIPHSLTMYKTLHMLRINLNKLAVLQESILLWVYLKNTLEHISGNTDKTYTLGETNNHKLINYRCSTGILIME